MKLYTYLNDIKKLDTLIEAKKAERHTLLALATDISPSALDGMPHGFTGKTEQKMQNAVCALVDLEKETEKLISQYAQTQKEITGILEKLPSREYGVLHRYYIRGMTLDEIADDMGYCSRQIQRIKRKGLALLEKGATED